MCESRELKYLSAKRHPSTWETRAVKLQMFWLYFASTGRPLHVTLRDLWPAFCLHMLKGLLSRHEPPAPPPSLAVKERRYSTHNQHHSDVSTCLSSHLTNFRWFPGVCVTALRFVNHSCSEITVMTPCLTRLSDSSSLDPVFLSLEPLQCVRLGSNEVYNGAMASVQNRSERPGSEWGVYLFPIPPPPPLYWKWA